MADDVTGEYDNFSISKSIGSTGIVLQRQAVVEGQKKFRKTKSSEIFDWLFWCNFRLVTKLKSLQSEQKKKVLKRGVYNLIERKLL